MPTPPTHCPGGVCEIKPKEPVQKFTLAQKIVVSLTFGIAIYGTYSYMYQLENKTMLGKKLSDAMMSDEERKIVEEKKYQAELDAFNNDDF